MPAGIAWQLTHVERLDAFSSLGWFLWPVVPLGYLAGAMLRRRLRR